MEEQLGTDLISDAAKACLGGQIVGLASGSLVLASRFCQRSVCVEIWEWRPGPKVAVWLFVFGGALAG